MAEFEQQLQSILSNPELMSQIRSMAGNLGGTPPAQSAPEPEPSMPFDPAALQNMMKLMSKSRLEPRQQELLHALRSYLPRDRLMKLEKAMQASKIAKYASSALLSPQNQGR